MGYVLDWSEQYVGKHDMMIIYYDVWDVREIESKDFVINLMLKFGILDIDWINNRLLQKKSCWLQKVEERKKTKIMNKIIEVFIN